MAANKKERKVNSLQPSDSTIVKSIHTAIINTVRLDAVCMAWHLHLMGIVYQHLDSVNHLYEWSIELSRC